MTLQWQDFEPLKNQKGGTSRFFEMVKKDLDIETNPKADRMLEIAWDHGHSSGFNDVYIYAQEMVELIR
jgi:hypothetical protein